MHDPAQTTNAINAWRESLGAKKVLDDALTLEKYGRTTQADAPQPSCVLYPESTEEVQAIVQIASEHGVVVYPISCGKNWGYGDACAASDGAAIIDLGRMNKILEVNSELAYCVIEPGVTQGQLYKYLQENKTGLWMDATAAGPDSSLVGNTADRGFGHTRYGDHILTTCSMEIVLANGRVLNTGFGHYEDARAAQVYPYGAGPFMNGIFTQSNYGIITRIGLWLLPEPEAFEFFYFMVDDFAQIEDLVDRLRPLRMNGTLTTAIHIGNDFRVMTSTGHYPWDKTKETPLSPELRDDMREQSMAKAWQGSGSISGSKSSVRAARKELKRALKGLCRPRFLTDWKVDTAEAIARNLVKIGLGRAFEWRMRIVRQNFDLLKGIPSSEPLRGAQWRLRKPPEGIEDLRDINIGLYWVSPVMPMLGSEPIAIQKIVEPIFHAHGFDMIVSFILLTERSVVAIFNIAFDKTVAEECQAASDCYDAMMKAIMENGYYIYRSGLQGMPKIKQRSSVYWDVATSLKRALDPQDIIARGRYIDPLETTASPTSQSSNP
ncbi:MAG: FAD-binding oxidoreductase [Candidatus Hydrogenedentota bacterium]